VGLGSGASAGVINELIIAHNITPYLPLRLFYRTSLATLIDEEPGKLPARPRYNIYVFEASTKSSGKAHPVAIFQSLLSKIAGLITHRFLGIYCFRCVLQTPKSS